MSLGYLNLRVKYKTIIWSINMKSVEQLNYKDKLLSRKEAAEFLGLKENTLAVWACNKTYYIPMFKIGKYVKYKLTDLIKFIEDQEMGKIHL